jgi:hypothetical protein
MISRLRQVLTVILLLLFSLENFANALVDDTSGEEFSVNHHLSTRKDNVTIFTWIIEQNENEEKSDDKAHGIAADLVPVSRFHTHHPDSSGEDLSPIGPSLVHDSHYILTLICRLTI